MFLLIFVGFFWFDFIGLLQNIRQKPEHPVISQPSSPNGTLGWLLELAVRFGRGDENARKINIKSVKYK